MSKPSERFGSRSAKRLLTDFAGGGLPLDWTLALDDVMGGRSRMTIEITRGTISLAGALDTATGGFAAVRTKPLELGLGAASAIELRVRGDDRTWQLRLHPSGLINHLRVTYRARFRPGSVSDWETVRLQLADFQPTWRGHILDGPPLDPAAVTALGFTIADGRDEPFRLEVASIQIATDGL